MNRILEEALKKPKINLLCDFKEIPRDLLIEHEDIINEIIKDEINKIHSYFDKNDTKIAQRDKIKCYVLTLIKCMTESLFLSFGTQTISKRQGKIVTTQVLYYISIPS